MPESFFKSLFWPPQAISGYSFEARLLSFLKIAPVGRRQCIRGPRTRLKGAQRSGATAASAINSGRSTPRNRDFGGFQSTTPKHQNSEVSGSVAKFPCEKEKHIGGHTKTISPDCIFLKVKNCFRGCLGNIWKCTCLGVLGRGVTSSSSY